MFDLSLTRTGHALVQALSHLLALRCYEWKGWLVKHNISQPKELRKLYLVSCSFVLGKTLGVLATITWWVKETNTNLRRTYKNADFTILFQSNAFLVLFSSMLIPLSNSHLKHISNAWRTEIMHTIEIMITHNFCTVDNLFMPLNIRETNNQQWIIALPLSISEFIVWFKACTINQKMPVARKSEQLIE